MTLAEVVVGLGIVTILIYTSVTFMTTATRGLQLNQNKQFAAQKAISILEELKALAQNEDPGATLDEFDDGAMFDPVLTTERVGGVPPPPQNSPSDNTRMNPTTWLYERQISVARIPGQSADVRLVKVRMYINEPGGKRLMAEVASVIRARATTFSPTQVYDVYAVAIENVPGWWVYMSNIVPFVNSTITNLQARNPGLEFRVHWITKLAYGRDQQYLPWINTTGLSTAQIANVYFYPGNLRAADPVKFYYPPSAFKARMKTEAGVLNPYDTTPDSGTTGNLWPYALADQYNHAMRYPDEVALFDLRKVDRANNDADGNPVYNEDETTPTWRMLIERMYSNPEQFTNAIIINLHGELLPFPPIRNYSDAAKRLFAGTSSVIGAAPLTRIARQNIRVVTHPEKLRYTNTPGDNVRLRVYSYLFNPNVGYAGNPLLTEPISVRIKGGAGIAGITVEYIAGGATAYLAPAVPPDFPGVGVRKLVKNDTGDTVIQLFNSPLTNPCNPTPATNCANGGLHPSRRLYGMEYIPSPVEDLPAVGLGFAFTQNLTTNSVALRDAPKNTARWIITIPETSLSDDVRLDIETRIGWDDAAHGFTNANRSGTLYPAAIEAPNLSKTYVWKGSDTWIYGDGTIANPPNLPLTERFQVQGDARHNPYADLKLKHFLGPGAEPTVPPITRSFLGMGYNRYFDNFQNGTVNAADGADEWTGYTYNDTGQYGVRNEAGVSSDNWNDIDRVEFDVNRAFQIMRSALTRSKTVYTTLTGFSYYYMGLGGDIGYDVENGFPAKGITVNARPYTGAIAGTVVENTIKPSTAGQGGVRLLRNTIALTTAATSWISMPWLGELYPDNMWSGSWNPSNGGNLPTPTNATPNANLFVREYRDLLNTQWRITGTPGTTFLRNLRRTRSPGCTTFFWVGSDTSTFHHYQLDDTIGNLAAAGLEIRTDYSVPVPDTIPNSRPFDLDVNRPTLNPPHFLQPAYGPVYEANNMATYYTHESGAVGSALLSLINPDNDDISFQVVNGLSPAGDAGTEFIARWSFLTLVQSFLKAGEDGALINRIQQVPRIKITSPNEFTSLTDPATISVGWSVEWLRWDGEKYTPAYPGGFTETTPLLFALKYSTDGGVSWINMLDGTPTSEGVRPATMLDEADANPQTWSVPAGTFPQGVYTIRVEAFRQDLSLHYAHHQYEAFIAR